MISASVYDVSGKVAGKINLPEEYFGAKVKPKLLAQARRVYLANQRKAQAKTKTRSEVNLTKAKWFRQKGTGRARHGAKSAPIFVGGGVAHGPRGNQNWKLTLPQAMRQASLAGALTSKLADKELFVVEDLGKIESKTKTLIKFLKTLLGKEKMEEKRQKFLLVLPGKIVSLSQAAKNLPEVKLVLASSLNAYEVLNGGKILFTAAAVKSLKKA